MVKIKDRGELQIFCDGGARGNPGLGAAACVIDDLAGKKRFLCGKYLGSTTNNKAEYTAVKLALEVVKKNFKEKRNARFFLDSKLVVGQLAGVYKVKNPHLRDLVFEIRGLESVLDEVYYQHVGREENKLADKLVNKSIDTRKGFLQVLAQ